MFIRDSFMHIHVTPQAIKRFLSVLFVFICFSKRNHLRHQICRPYGMYSALLDLEKQGKTRKTGKKGGDELLRNRTPDRWESGRMSRFFKRKFVHGFEAIWNENGPNGSIVRVSLEGKPRGKRPIFAHVIWFCARFLPLFGAFLRFCKHAKK